MATSQQVVDLGPALLQDHLPGEALPLLLVISALSALLFHWRVLPALVRGFAWVLRKSLGIGGALGLGAAANIFVGMTEAPLLIRPYLREMSRGALFAAMAVAMATVAGTSSRPS